MCGVAASGLWSIPPPHLKMTCGTMNEGIPSVVPEALTLAFGDTFT